jgi:hypothetical protein
VIPETVFSGASMMRSYSMRVIADLNLALV